MIKQRRADIDDLLGTDSAVNPTATPLDPRTNSQWYQGTAIPKDFFVASATNLLPSWEETVISTLPVGSVTNTIAELIRLGSDRIPEYYTGDASIYETEEGSLTFYEDNPIYQKNFSEFWQINNRWYTGAPTYISAPTQPTNGAAVSAQGDGSVPGFIFGLDNGSGELQVFMTDTYAESNIDGVTGIDSTVWSIANGVKLGDKAVGQWVHRAVTRKGNKFTTWENGVLVSQWISDLTVKRNTLDAKTGGITDRASLNLSIGRTQQSNYFKGYIDGFKFTKGEALYDTAFTPSTTAPTIDNTANKKPHNIESILKKVPVL